MSNFTDRLASHVRAESGRTPETSSEMEFWSGMSRVVVDHLADDWEATTRAYAATRQQHYFSAEFLMGRALLNNLLNLGLVDEAEKAVESHGKNLADVLEAEHDAALGNGGLGRLAACFLDSCATQDLPATGYGILYRYGLFKQSFEDGFQDEHPDPWMEEGYPFVVRREDEARIVRFDDLTVRAVPHDMPITGYGTKNVNTLRLWNSEPMREFDYDAFNSQRFTDAIVERERVHDLCRVLYPNDSTYEGKVLRVRQQYFFVSASLQAMVDSYIAEHGEDMSKFAEYNCIQLNDTHPVLAIPELMRILLDERGMSWEDAWAITSKAFAYTNHTVLAEALETWEFSIFERLFRRVLEIIQEIDRRFRLDLDERGIDHATIDYMAPISHGLIHMAWIACYTAYSINGVAALHTEIIKRETLGEWHDIWPEKFNNKTNGVTPRRWLNQCNPRLAALLTRLTGDDEWVSDLDTLAELEKFADDEDVLREVMAIKRGNKEDFAEWIEARQGISISPDAIFDSQIKRLHEYKRQLLNALQIIYLYQRLQDDPTLDIPPQTFLFGAKAAPGYAVAKRIIHLINSLADQVNSDPLCKDRLQVVFLENYRVSLAEVLMPASEVSQQISTAGKEASGTGNMKFMMNGALTVGTLDGANVEMHDLLGDDNMFLFGLKADEVEHLRHTYDPNLLYQRDPVLRRVLDQLKVGFRDGVTYEDLFQRLVTGVDGQADQYMVLADFAAYCEAESRMRHTYTDRETWNRMSLTNIARSGVFAADRAIAQYADTIWHVPYKK